MDHQREPWMHENNTLKTVNITKSFNLRCVGNEKID